MKSKIKLAIILSMLTTPILAENTSKAEDKLSAKQQKQVINLIERFMHEYEGVEHDCGNNSQRHYCINRTKSLEAKSRFYQELKDAEERAKEPVRAKGQYEE